ncbi:MAG TPA: hypothetical protein VIM12_19995 [Noviherbaspirillum sp.]|jgi:hypothetical protein|uniref:hypothetical protein n=1 Tax=Noviherbaspirillum sp. TaxID=1926288 RepID=UPI002F957E7F
MDIDENEVRRMFEEWAEQKNYPKELWPVLWDAYIQGVYDAPSSFLDVQNWQVKTNPE